MIARQTTYELSSERWNVTAFGIAWATKWPAAADLIDSDIGQVGHNHRIEAALCR